MEKSNEKVTKKVTDKQQIYNIAKKMFLTIDNNDCTIHKYSYNDIATKTGLTKTSIFRWSKEPNEKNITWLDEWNLKLQNAIEQKIEEKSNDRINNINTKLKSTIADEKVKQYDIQNKITNLQKVNEVKAEKKVEILEKSNKRIKDFLELESVYLTILKKKGIDILNKIKQNPNAELDISTQEFNAISKGAGYITNAVNNILEAESKNTDNNIVPEITIVKRYESQEKIS
jgi:hypothetical protein